MDAARAGGVRGGWRRAVRVFLGVDEGVYEDLVIAMRGLFLRMLMLMSLLAAPLLAAGEAPAAWRVAGAAALACLVAWWVLGHRRGAFPLWGVVPEGLALGVLGVAVGDPPRALAVIYVALYFRASFGRAQDATALGVTYVAAHLGAVAVAGLLGFAPDATTVTAPGIIQQVPGFATGIVLIRLLVGVASRREGDVRRQRVLADVGTVLAAADQRDDLALAACDGAAALVDLPEACAVAVAFLDDGDLVVAASTDAGMRGAALDPHALPELRGQDTAGRVPGAVVTLDADAVPARWSRLTAVPLVVDGAVAGALLVQAVERQLPAALMSLALQAGLALARIDATHEIQAREARFRSLVANANEVIRVVDGDGIIVDESEPVRRVLGYDPAELIGRSAFELMHPDDVADLRRLFEVVRERPAGRAVAAEGRMRHADGSWRHLEGTIRNLLQDPAVKGCVINYRDVTQRKVLEAELRHRALHDPLTDLPNRALFADRVGHALRAQARSDVAIAVIFIDLDDFKTINDRLGHSGGDAVLKGVGAGLMASVRPSDTCARLGGDEFGVLLVDVSGPEEGFEACKRILAAVREPVRFEGHSVAVDASIGIVVSSGHETADDIVRNADLAMYQAKTSGKGRYELFEHGMRAVRTAWA